jgi:hypothetical protein
VFNPSHVAVSVANGMLSLRAVGDSLWLNNNEGVLVYKMVNGDFKATTTVHVSKASDPSMPPDQAIHLGGIMTRNPAGPPENFVLLVIGFAEMGHLAVENKTTTNGSSQFGETPWTADAELRLCRVGASITLLYRTPGTTTWTTDLQLTRSDLPATLQIGPNLYAHSTSSDLIASFDRFAIDPVGGGCTQ